MGIKFCEFDMVHGCWKNYITRFEFCLQANDINDENKKKANLLAVCGSELFDLIISLASPTSIEGITYEAILQVLNKHFHPTPNEIVESFKFHSRNQEEGEKVKDYVANLRKLSIHCNFEDLDRTLRDRLVCGIRSKEVQRKLLQCEKLTFTQASEIAFSHETATFDSNIILMPGPSKPSLVVDEPMEVNKITNKKFDKQTKPCFRCGRQHRGECKFRWSKCNFCGKTGHIESVCLSKNSTLKSNCNGLYVTTINNVRECKVDAYMVKVSIEGSIVEMEVDSGCAFTLISEATARLIWNGELPILEKGGVILTTWTDNHLNILGKTKVEVSFKGLHNNLMLYIARGNGPSLIGRNWFEPLRIQVQGVYHVIAPNTGIKELLQKYNEVFQEGLGKYKGPMVNITPKEGSVPKFLKSRPIPFALRDRVFKEIDRLVDEEVLVPTAHSDWATPIVPVLKSNGTVRLCGDYRSTVNLVTDTDTYPLPTLDEAFTALQGGIIFSKIDLERAYTQVSVDEPTAQLLTINTPKGLYKMKRLAFGVKACPGIFQRLMSSLLAGIKGIAVLLDDIVVSGANITEHNMRLEMVLKKLNEAGLRLNKGKCSFAANNVNFLGFLIDEYGIHPCEDKIHAIENTPAPSTVKELQAFLGLLNFYDRFLPHKANIAEPLYKLLNKDAKWQWTSQHQRAFEKLRSMLSSTDTLVHYDVNRKIIMSCDASQYGMGAVLEHVMDDGSARPIKFASRTMNIHERNYAQIDKEAAAIVFGLKKFHQFISGRKIIIRTDHKPLLGLFEPKKPIPNVISPRMLRWALLLNSYDYSIQYVEGKKLGNADALSRWPNRDQSTEDEYLGVLLIEETPTDLELSASEVSKLTTKDRTLSKVLYWIRNGWPAKVELEYKLFWQKRMELSEYKNCILWGNRVIIPEKMRPYILQELHNNHDGIIITKALARSYFWWPAIDKDIEKLVKSCETCGENRNMPAQVSHKWIRPEKAWSRLHIDYAGPFQGKMFLILIDAYSKWPEVKIVPDMSSETLINTLRNIFADQGLPDTLVSDNGRSFISEQFRMFLSTNGIRQVLTPPYHPASNGQAERTVQTVKNKLRKQQTLPWHIKLPTILYGLRTTPSSTSDKSPAELLNNRRFRTKFDHLNPLTFKDQGRIDACDENENTRVRSFSTGQSVFFRNYGPGPRWLKGIVEKRQGVCRYIIQWNGKSFKRHINQMQSHGGEEVVAQNIMQPELVHAKEKPQEEDDDEDDVQVSATPPASRWEDIIGVSGPQDYTFYQSPEHIPPASKRIRSPASPLDKEAKRRVLDGDRNLSEPEDGDSGSSNESI